MRKKNKKKNKDKNNSKYFMISQVNIKSIFTTLY